MSKAYVVADGVGGFWDARSGVYDDLSSATPYLCAPEPMPTGGRLVLQESLVRLAALYDNNTWDTFVTELPEGVDRMNDESVRTWINRDIMTRQCFSECCLVVIYDPYLDCQLL